MRCGILFKIFLIPKLLNNSLACFLINLDFLVSHTTYFYKSIILSLLVFQTLGFLVFSPFVHFKNPFFFHQNLHTHTHPLLIILYCSLLKQCFCFTKINILCIFDCFFMSLYSFNISVTEANSS